MGLRIKNMQDINIVDLGAATSLNYHKSLNIARRLYAKADADDKKVISGMISDCEYVEEWLNTGRRPGNKRGAERMAAYQRERPVDPLRMQAYVQRNHAGSPANLSEWQLFQIEDALSTLSPRERECYTMAHGQCFSRSQIAEFLDITRDSVTEYVERAQKKVAQAVSESLFLSPNCHL
ncbi:sigma factor-like helix-turn-helix DNA-binding protein [Paenibacillus polymyxa]|uniref:ECF subfamily RNA polymerase sigma-24 subunit n=1 Tax=Paenibacillus polymyxa TaxID=1406 RepID=A0A378XX56_PAEPO|nr:sigma factor-like helix-turn-helix DNA-binding protein [Paenibacillus polymyxa]MCC3257479.1 RNA polymerase subunit sigma-24 [Paenibacillus polymyxa]SUA68207.1 ECF subfamily RNA polymerase sigma-24 subunit [Paenibacillus polymyxa]